MEIADLLKETALFHNLQEEEIELISRSTRLEKFQAGKAILREGRVGTAFYVIVSGRVEVVKDMDGTEPAVLATFGPGDFFGEIATIRHLPRSASVRALEDTQCLVLWRADFPWRSDSMPWWHIHGLGPPTSCRPGPQRPQRGNSSHRTQQRSMTAPRRPGRQEVGGRRTVQPLLLQSRPFLRSRAPSR